MNLKYTIFAVLLLMQSAEASTYTLDKILKSMKEHSALTKSLHYEKLSLEAKNKADTASEPVSLIMEGTRAYPVTGKSGTEYIVGVAKKFALPGVLSQEHRMTALSNQAYLLEKEKSMLDFENALKNLYHQHCLDLKNYRSFKASYLDFVTIFKKKQKAYQYQEISKMELIQLETEKNKQYAQLQTLEMRQKISRQKLLTLGNVSGRKDIVFSCQDMYPIRSKIDDLGSFSLSREAYEKRIKSTEEAMKRYSRTLDSVATYAHYTDELDMDKYSIGVSIPLNFTSHRYEEERAAAMYKNSAIQYDFEQQILQKRSIMTQLQSELQSHALMIDALKKSAFDYTRKLFPLVQKSFDLGETSVLEYLINRQKLYQIREAIYTEKVNYYSTLFRLYTISESKERK